MKLKIIPVFQAWTYPILLEMAPGGSMWYFSPALMDFFADFLKDKCFILEQI